jgi:hypothetical protein
MLDVYSSPPWTALCAEVAKLKLSLREGSLITLHDTAPTPGRWLKTDVGDAARASTKPKRSPAGWPTSGQRAPRKRRGDVQPLVAVAVMVATPTCNAHFRTSACAFR